MATYYRPNLTSEQRDTLLALVEAQLEALTFKDAEFDRFYRLRLKLADCKSFQS